MSEQAASSPKPADQENVEYPSSVMLQVAPSVGRFNAVLLPPELLLNEYNAMLEEDPGVRTEALNAAYEMRRTPIDDLDQKTVTMNMAKLQDEGKVGRRAPPNPFHSPLLRGVTTKKGALAGQVGGDKASDPALSKNPLRGRLIVTVAVNGALFMIFCQSLIANRLSTGSFYVNRSENSNIGPSSMTLYDLGGLNANAVRQGETIRLFWAMWMHSGWLHIGLNIACQLQYFYMLEPDWGIVRTLLIFWVSGISGNLMSMIMDPCKTTVGSSGGLFGLMGGVVPYCIEYWHTIPRPMCILIFSIFTVLLTLATGLTKSTDSWAHVGGLLGGLLFGFATITTPAAFMPKDRVVKRRVRRHAIMRWFQNAINPECKCGPREWIIRLSSLSLLGMMWALCFTYLLVKYEYHPPGSLTFSGVTHCCCCYDFTDTSVPAVKDKEHWYCQDCASTVYENDPLTWQEYCEGKTQ